MARLAALVVLLAAPGASAFTLNRPVRAARVLALATEDTDFDAPVLANPQTASGALDHEIVVGDDECYLGKYGQYADCVDFGEWMGASSLPRGIHSVRSIEYT